MLKCEYTRWLYIVGRHTKYARCLAKLVYCMPATCVRVRVRARVFADGQTCGRACGQACGQACGPAGGRAGVCADGQACGQACGPAGGRAGGGRTGGLMPRRGIAIVGACLPRCLHKAAISVL